MAYLLKAISGLGLFGAGIALANVKLVKLLETGTCASGNTPYVIRHPCPPGTGGAILLLMAGIFAAVIGAGLFAARGTPSWAKDRPHRVSTFSVTWGHRLHGHRRVLADHRARRRLARPGREARRPDRWNHLPTDGSASPALRPLEPDLEPRLA
jgi:hypothetical protein